MKKDKEMKTKIMLPKDFCEIEAVKYIAFRYGTTPEKVIEHYFVQSGIKPSTEPGNHGYSLTPNEMALFQDLGVGPTVVEIQ